MHLKEVIGRALDYGQRRGVRAAVSRVAVSIQRGLTGGRLVVFYCDLISLKSSISDLAEDMRMERKRTTNDLERLDVEQFVEAWNPEIRRRQLAERFDLGASLWLLKLKGHIVAYGWTMAGRTVEPHFIPLGNGDVHLFDFYVFPQHRGRRLNVGLVGYILFSLASEGYSRAFIEAAEWNVAQLSSLKRMPFQKLGCARKFNLFGKTVVIWSGKQ